MIIVVLTDCPPKLRGDLSKWLFEIITGVYVGKVSTRVREALWSRICESINHGQATMVNPAAKAHARRPGRDRIIRCWIWRPLDFLT